MALSLARVALALTCLGGLASPALADDAADRVREACADLFNQLPAEWPAHLAGDEPLGVFVGEVVNHSNARGVDVAGLLDTAHAQVDGHPRLATVVAGHADTKLLLVGSLHAALLRTGVVELAVPPGSRAMRLIADLRSAAKTESTELPAVEAPRVGLTIDGTLEGELELTLWLRSSLDDAVLASPKASLGDVTAVPVSSAEAEPAASPSPKPPRDTGRRKTPRTDSR